MCGVGPTMVAREYSLHIPVSIQQGRSLCDEREEGYLYILNHLTNVGQCILSPAMERQRTSRKHWARSAWWRTYTALKQVISCGAGQLSMNMLMQVFPQQRLWAVKESNLSKLCSISILISYVNKELVIVSMTQVSLQYLINVHTALRCSELCAAQKMEVMKIP